MATNPTTEFAPATQSQPTDPELVTSEADTDAKIKAKASGWVAWLMDEVISIPGTNIKIGLDPLFGLIPGGGDFASSTVSCVSLIEAMRRGLPFIATWKIVGNIMVNLGVGTVPVVGDIFSVMFRSNSRNRDLINKHLKEAVDAGREPSWWRIVPVIGFILLMVICAVMANLFIWYWITNTLLPGDFKMPFN